MPAPPAVFVGREELLGRLLEQLDPRARTIRSDVLTGVLGMGKSALLLHIEGLTREGDNRFDAAYLDLAPYGQSGGHDDDLSYGAAVQDYDLFSGFAYEVLKRLAPAGLADLERARKAHMQRSREVKSLILNVYATSTIGDNAFVSSSGLTVSAEGSTRGAADARYIAESRTWIEEERDLLVEALNDRPGENPVLLLLDNVDAVLERNFSSWLRGALQRLEGVAVVMTQEPGAKTLLPTGVRDIPVPPLRESDVHLLLVSRKVDRPGQENLAAVVHQFTGGVPVAVEVLIDLLNDADAGIEVQELQERLRRLPHDPQSRLDEVVATMEDHYHGRPLGVALRAASVPERCDAPLLGKLLTVEGVPAEAAPDLLRDLAALSVVAESLSRDYSVEVHPFIRRALLESMRRLRPDDLKRYHEIAAGHYFTKITRADTYGTMFDFEDVERAEVTRQWLRHVARSGEPRTSILQAARVFFDAMWWWGNYVEFDFCETLTTDFEAEATAGGDATFAEFAAAVRTFLQHYPFRARLRQDFEHGYPPAGWDEVQEQLLVIQDLCGVLDMSREPTHEANHVKALTETFLAHTYRYATQPDHEEALACYGRALERFRLVDRWWDVPWITFEAADLAREAGDVAAARQGVAAAARQLADHIEPEEPDEELIANLHRLLADCARDEGSTLTAAHEYGLAVRHAYLFHRIGGPPDDYTMQYYFEIRGRALQWLTRLGQEDPEGALAAASTMRRAAWGRVVPPVGEESVGVALHDGQDADLALALFPRGPDVGELGLPSSPFMRELNRFRHRTGDSSLGDVLEAVSASAGVGTGS